MWKELLARRVISLYKFEFCSMGKREDSYNKRRLRMAYVTSVVSVAMVLFVLGVLGGVIISGKKLAEHARNNLKLQVFLVFGISDNASEEIKTFIAANEYVDDVRLITPEEALQEYKEKMGEDPMLMLDENPLPTTLEVTLKAEYASNEYIEELESTILTTYPEQVAEMYKDAHLIDEVNMNISRISYVLLGVCLLLSVIMIALINNTIRLAIFSKRFLIKTMQLVGATGSFIRKPFIRAGVVQGIVGGMISCLGMVVLLFWIKSMMPDLFQPADMLLFGLLIGGVLLIGVLISYASTRMAVQKFLKLKMDELY